jgi:hypothetical protein
LDDGKSAASLRGRVALRSKVFLTMAIGLALSACAGRDPHPVAVVQPQDQYSDCAMIKAEIEANNTQAQKLADENGWKVAQNVLTGVGGLVFFPVWFAMDAKGAAGTEADALKSRQEFLAKLAEERCAPGYRPPPPGSAGPHVPQAYAPPQR